MLRKKLIFTIMWIPCLHSGRSAPVGCYINENARRAIVELSTWEVTVTREQSILSTLFEIRPGVLGLRDTEPQEQHLEQLLKC